MPQGPFIRRRGRSATIDFQLFEADGVDFRVDALHAAGDTKVMKDEGAEANTTNGFTDEGLGYSIVLTDTEMHAARIVVYAVDATATKVWLDTALVIETFDPPGLLQASDIATLASQTSFTLAEGSADDDAYNGAMAIITDAATLAQKAVGLISDYTGSTKTVTLVADPGIFTMAAGDYIDIIAVPKQLPAAPLNDPTASAIADAVWDEAKSGHVAAGSFGEEEQAHALSSEITALNDISSANVNTEVSDVLKTDTVSEMAQQAPPTTPTLEEAIMYIYMALVHKVDITATLKEFHNNAGAVIWKKTLSDDATTYSEAESASGP